jgi:CheY-like chemotaxis protein
VKLPLMIVHAPTDSEARIHPTSPRTGSDVAMPDLHGLSVVAVDDDADALSLVSEILEAAGARVTVAHSAAEALVILESTIPTVIVADIGMPAMDGLAFIARVRQHADENVRGVPAAALTAYARSDDRIKAMRAGFQLHLAKPIDPAELLTAVAALGGRPRGQRF